MFNDCHCVVGLRRRYERISLMGCGTSSQCACREKLFRVFCSEYCNVNHLACQGHSQNGINRGRAKKNRSEFPVFTVLDLILMLVVD